MSGIKPTAIINRPLMHEGPRISPNVQQIALRQSDLQWPPSLSELVQISANQKHPIHTYEDM
jgi:hypothetical protein